MSALRPLSGVIQTLSRHRRMTDFDPMLLKKSLMRSVEPSDQLLRAFFVPLFVLLSGRTGEFSAGVQRSRHVGRH
jgi:hypothetical protein